MSTKIVPGHSASDAERCGNKAASLARLSRDGFRVPKFLVVPVDGDMTDADYLARLRAFAGALGGPATYAVRSSGLAEDGGNHSHAGMYRTYLNVTDTDLADRIAAVRGSGSGRRLQAYRASRSLGAEAEVPAVIVQRMVTADAAGVAFAADPVTGCTDRITVAAVRGCCEGLVNGEEQGDTWILDRRGRILERACEDPGSAVLTDRRIRKVAALVSRVSARCGRPQDIEWAFEGRRLYLLQSRDITTLGRPEGGGRYALWDNSNIVESYGGVTTPMTYSVARAAYADAYRNLGRVIGVSERSIRAHARDYDQMIGLMDGRVYYNLLSWYRLLMLIPGFRYNRRFMEQMMGVTQALPESSLRPDHDGPLAGLRSGMGLARVALRLLRRLFGHERRVCRFHADIARALRHRPISEFTAEELCDYYDELQSAVVPAWDTPLVNDLFCMASHGLLRSLCQRWLPDDLHAAHNELLRGESSLISLEPVHRMRRMADIVREAPELEAALGSGVPGDLDEAIAMHPEFEAEYSAYLDRFGDRCIDELKLESPTLADDPSSLLQAVAQLARRDVNCDQEPVGDGRREYEARILSSLGRRGRRLVFRAVLRRTRAAVRDRENLRFERTRVYGRVRAIVLELGRRLAASDLLHAADDVFYLELGEVMGVVRGTGSSTSLAETARLRRLEFDAYRAGPTPPRRFVTCGPPQLPGSRRAVEDAKADGDGNVPRAQGCSPGIARGPVRIVRDPRSARIRSGDILVAERTDPGWVTLFPAAAGIIMERGSLLSHTAIVARELAIPCVVGAEGACHRLRDGEWVELDGASGSIRRLDSAGKAA